MERVYTIGADTHCGFTELATISPGGRLVRRDRCPTTIAALVQVVAEIRSPRVTVIEEGPLADWLFRGLSERGVKVVVCDPRRNVARSLATVMWGMWKSGDDYRPEWVGTAVGPEPAVLPD